MKWIEYILNNDVFKDRYGGYCLCLDGKIYDLSWYLKYNSYVERSTICEIPISHDDIRKNPDHYQFCFNLNWVVEIKEEEENLYDASDIFKIEYEDLKKTFVKKEKTEIKVNELNQLNNLIWEHMDQIKKSQRILKNLIEKRDKIEKEFYSKE